MPIIMTTDLPVGGPFELAHVLLTCPRYVLSPSELPGTARCSRVVLHSPCLSPETSHLAEEL